ncbi:hypothetical protein GCM10009604_17430 [Corynebacterium aurimucosum]|nr:3-hydroxyisobutyrate dehydrogenase [Corynebacterium aurimucosum]
MNRGEPAHNDGTLGGMKIAFLGTGRMGTELARHLLKNHELTVWNRTAERAQPLVDAGATLADSPTAAVEGAEVIITSLFGPDDIRERVIDTNLIPEGVTWIDTTTVSPMPPASSPPRLTLMSTRPSLVHWAQRARASSASTWARLTTTAVSSP